MPQHGIGIGATDAVPDGSAGSPGRAAWWGPSAGRAPRRSFRSGLRLGTGVLLGAATALVDLGYLAGAVPGYAALAGSPRSRRRLAELARRLAEYDRRRVERYFGDSPAGTVSDARAVGYLAARAPVGVLGGIVLLMMLYGAVVVGAVIVGWLVGRPVDDIEATPVIVVYFGVLAVVLLFLAVQGVVGVAALDRRLARRFLGPSGRELLERRITELSASRAGVLAAVDAERRRIERDLHDGVQQRLVALGMLVGRARRTSDPAKATELLRQAHEESARVLDDLREVAWRVYPTALDNLGLADALARVAEHAGLPVRVDCRLVGRPARAVETAAYFVVSEAVTNAAKHARAGQVDVGVVVRDGRLVVTVVDDGVGGADPAGAGLSGLARRVAALDGRLRVTSPAGGPTTIEAELPCG
ncbi:histidine kinase [Micromonospora sp. WMMD1102]|uniref:sensor histidine kinase n=1 Tax=Micromonospora sp. WMMD1102 TaxID=3016105 RepID=UPI002415145D|nr:histidine kinase [Micromonospora sp. WMMD1102]MDG4791023.1 histidine kinase [Micromonospora sp. WMMD1102]